MTSIPSGLGQPGFHRSVEAGVSQTGGAGPKTSPLLTTDRFTHDPAQGLPAGPSEKRVASCLFPWTRSDPFDDALDEKQRQQAVGEREKEAHDLVETARSLEKEGNLPFALSYLDRALGIYEETRNVWKMARVCHMRGGVLVKMEDYYAAEGALEKAIGLYGSSHSLSGTNMIYPAFAWDDIAGIYFAGRDYEAMRAPLEQAAAYYKKAQDASYSPIAILNRAESLLALGEFQKVTEEYGGLIEKWEKMVPSGEVYLRRLQKDMGDACLGLGMPLEAVGYYQRALRNSYNVEDPALPFVEIPVSPIMEFYGVHLLFLAGSTAEEKGRVLTELTPVAEKAVSSLQEENRPDLASQVRLLQALANREMGKGKEADGYFREAVVLHPNWKHQMAIRHMWQGEKSDN